MGDTILTAQAKAHGGREGHVQSENGVIDLKLKMPKAGEEVKDATNPEQLFAAGYAACFDGALNLIASKAKKEIESEIEAEVSLVKDSSDGGFKIAVTLNALVQGVSDEEANELVHKAHDFCPYSKATRGNVEVTLNVITR
ncbi:Organic hydroperoxide resistance protein ohrA [Alkalihalobacillus alcalophilus ATCC 27647 = CGMCC 1.3604]|uniref:Organic hydroperoxide resistance protein OhrA n=1 Tax=Alkalihalobacillus alcalophilus ATCC 27647 = CGMCC 1.3604 TaxID=1218173 RepID=A0A094WFI4_ALKAL|nr:organic hydroperoxide resistance protein [Alkalihalobacillus alcalophilus]KGA95526.1 Organic hydroperoxide resistance protein OhrA [Alkalihalobacillus alcalophilus ATCC 27647 = CGMCC 1.3604]MED1564286.1 organic hydroperoxide resistance protein [Alkalihalobacillus alcalophilus]THG88661.1 Organic hydroperoxide resistance protein ohrA [Alkalihalobacillus alcalophilus ATCC 27647 = CGMCC 1.3604]